MMNKNIQVSVIIPVYNKEKFISACIKSIQNQSYKNLEIILVNDGSLDDSGQLCEQEKEKDERIIVIHQKNKGVSVARQMGVKEATGDYVMFIDGDDWIEQNCIEVMLYELLCNNVDCVCCGYVREHNGKKFETHLFDGDRLFRGKEYYNKFYRRFFGLVGEELSNPERIDSIVSCCMKLYPRSALIKGKYIDHKEVGSCEDALLNMTTLIHLSSVKYIDRCFYHYRKDNSDSITYTYRPDLISQWSVLYNYMEDLILEYNLPEIFQNALRNRIALSTVGYGLTEVSAPNKGYIKKVKTFRTVLSRPEYKDAFEQLDFEYFPIKWKIYFLLCKHHICSIVMIMLSVMQYLRKRKAV